MARSAAMGALALATALVAAATMAGPAVLGTASATSTLPMTSTMRACDFTKSGWVSAVGYGTAIARVGAAGGQVGAVVDLARARPGTSYLVRVIQMPRPSIGCAPGAPGVITGTLATDYAGAGSVSLAGPVAPGATGAWVIVQLPAEYTQTPAEFYTSDLVGQF